MPSDIRIEIDRSKSTGTFTNYDVIEGRVILTVTDSITLTCIQVKLEGITKTQLTVPVQKNRKVEHKLVSDTHKVLYETAIVFPPENVRQVSHAKDFTLTPGNYSYPFSFTIPLNNSCSKVSGITNLISFNKKSFDVSINGGNLKRLVGDQTTPPNVASNGEPPYHIVNQLPPTLTRFNDHASVQYFVKVTGQRSSILKVNLRAFDPFIFLPLDLIETTNHGTEEYKEVFVRKQVVFKDRIPEIVGVYVPDSSKPRQRSTSSSSSSNTPAAPNQPKKGFLSSVFESTSKYANNISLSQGIPRRDYYQIDSKDVPFWLEVRFKYPSYLVPAKRPTFQVFLISNLNPSRYTLNKYGRPEESNGLGVLYLQKLTVELTSTTIVSVRVKNDFKYETRTQNFEEKFSLCNNTYDNLRFDLKDSKRSANDQASSSSSTVSLNSASDGHMYELEIPAEYFSNCVVPDHVSPTFRTCNISRQYDMKITAGMSCNAIHSANPATSNQVKYIDLVVSNIDVLSGLNLTKELAANSGMYTNAPRNDSTSPPITAPRPSGKSDTPPELPPKNEHQPANLPTYDDAVRENSFQDTSEHQRARRRYQEHNRQ